MNPKQLKKLKKQHRDRHESKPADYIIELSNYATLFADYPVIKFLNTIKNNQMHSNCY